jgi:hypothetical protein
MYVHQRFEMAKNDAVLWHFHQNSNRNAAFWAGLAMCTESMIDITPARRSALLAIRRIQTEKPAHVAMAG